MVFPPACWKQKLAGPVQVLYPTECPGQHKAADDVNARDEMLFLLTDPMPSATLSLLFALHTNYSTN